MTTMTLLIRRMVNAAPAGSEFQHSSHGTAIDIRISEPQVGDRSRRWWSAADAEPITGCEGDDMDGPQAPAGRTAAERADRLLSIFAGVAAVTAVIVSLYQASLARQQSRAAAWPYLSQSNSLDFGKPYTRTIANKGVGPARVRSVQVTVDGRVTSSWTDAIRALTGSAAGAYSFSHIGAGSVLSPGTADTLLTLANDPTGLKFWNEAPARLSVIVCYCSVYDECWIVQDRQLEPRSVRSCPVVATGAFEQ
jgi:hypothetical protein